MRTRHVVAGFIVLTGVYVGALLWTDSRNDVPAALPRLASAMPVLVALSIGASLVRYVRWHWLLVRSGHRTGVWRGLLAYLAGFAFTATPGKVGELVRIRYLVPMGVPPYRVVGAFVYERTLDLVVVLAFASLAIPDPRLFALALASVSVFLAAVVVAVRNPGWLTGVADALRPTALRGLARVVETLRDGLSSCSTWITWTDGLVGVGCGIVAWTIASGAFAWLLADLGMSVPPAAAFAVFPLAMLAGAASMLPGGIGSTEAAIVAILAMFDVPPAVATLAAVGIRLSSLWFAVLCGLLAAAILEAGHGAAGGPSLPGR